MSFICISLLGDQRFVRFRVEQLREILPVGRLHLEEPCGVCVLVHLLRRVGKLRVDGDDFAADRRIDVRGGLNRFDDRACVAGGEFASDFGQFEVHEVAERGLRVIGDADRKRAVRFGANPLVLGRVSEIRRNVHRASVQRERNSIRNVMCTLSYAMPSTLIAARALPQATNPAHSYSDCAAALPAVTVSVSCSSPGTPRARTISASRSRRPMPSPRNSAGTYMPNTWPLWRTLRRGSTSMPTTPMSAPSAVNAPSTTSCGASSFGPIRRSIHASGFSASSSASEVNASGCSASPRKRNAR